MKKQNCWEYMKCGRHPGGRSAAGSGVCPVSLYEELNGVHGGKNAGRACWTVDNSLCPDLMRETAAKKFPGCWKCDFYHHVKNEERSSPHGFIITYREMKIIHEQHGCSDGIAPEALSDSRGCKDLDGGSAPSCSSDALCDQKG